MFAIVGFDDLPTPGMLILTMLLSGLAANTRSLRSFPADVTLKVPVARVEEWLSTACAAANRLDMTIDYGTRAGQGRRSRLGWRGAFGAGDAGPGPPAHGARRAPEAQRRALCSQSDAVRRARPEATRIHVKVLLLASVRTWECLPV